MEPLVRVTAYRGLLVFDVKAKSPAPYKLFIDPEGGGIWLNDPGATLAISEEAVELMHALPLQPDAAVFGDIDWYLNAAGTAAVGWNLKAARVSDVSGLFAAFDGLTTRTCSRLCKVDHLRCLNETRAEVRAAIDLRLQEQSSTTC